MKEHRVGMDRSRTGRFLLVAMLLASCAPTGARAVDATAPTNIVVTAPPPTAVVTTPAPAPSVDPLRVKVGAAVTYNDGWKVTALRWSDQPSGRFSSPKPGNRFVVVIVRYDNGTAKPGSFNAFEWKMQDSAGVRRMTSFFSDRDDGLSSGDLASGGFVSGSLVFEVPSGDARLELIYEPFITYKQATWELY